jgi:hypothetical protein
MAARRARRDTTLWRWTGQLERGGACRLPDGAVRFLASALELFAAQFESHTRSGPCRSCRLPRTVVTPPAARTVAA